MGRYRAKDLVNAPTLVSFLRVPLAAAFPFVRDHVGACLVVLALAAGTDILDGYIARRYGLATPTGAVVDGVTDKLFVGVVLATLLLTNTMSATELVLLGTRELGELPLLVWVAASAKARRRKVEDQANVFGKAATVLQFSAIVAMLVHSPIRTALVALTVLVGAGAAVSYWHRVIVARRENA